MDFKGVWAAMEEPWKNGPFWAAIMFWKAKFFETLLRLGEGLLLREISFK
ncbi:unnamed protein product [Prunus armeniaca]|uniref:Uncharacterized protein n=1 Tax=Prunus armeniaca TaxID=36596 RepID=A0A6J5Y6S3_PRUAR|nr:unnamed protein product [Prunus armeniaca]